MDKLIETRKERLWHPEALQRDRWVKLQADRLPSQSRVLDAGAGASKYRPYFAHCRYETQDFCQYEGPLVKYLQPVDHVCDITKIPLPDSTFDAILCTEVLEHVTDPMAVLAEFARLLKPGGKLLLSAPQCSFEHMEPYHYYGGFTRYWYQKWLPHHGFVIESLDPYGGPGHFVAYAMGAFYDCWRTWEQGCKGIKRLISLAVRMLLAKIPVHYLLPWFLRRCDRHLSRERMCSGYLVAATNRAASRG